LEEKLSNNSSLKSEVIEGGTHEGIAYGYNTILISLILVRKTRMLQATSRLCAVIPSPRLPAVLRHVVYNGEEFVANQVSSILVTMEVGSNHDFNTFTLTEQFECCYHSIQSLLSPHLLSRNVKSK
jgi:hypothetical protein